MADNLSATKSTPSAPGGGASGVLGDLPDGALRRMADRLPAEQGERNAAIIYAGLDNGTAARGAAAPAVSSSAGKAKEVPIGSEKAGDEDNGSAVDDAEVAIPPAAAPGVPSSARKVPRTPPACPSPVAHRLATQSKTAAAPGVSGNLAVLPPGSAPHRVADRLAAEEGEGFAALFREVRGSPNHVAVEFYDASHAGLDNGAVVEVSSAAAATPAVSSSAGKKGDEVPSDKEGDEDYGTAVDDAEVAAPPAAAPGVPSSAGKVPRTPPACPSTLAHRLATLSKTAAAPGASGNLADLPSGSAPNRVADRLAAEEGEGFAALFREVRGSPNHVAAEFCATRYGGLYNGTAAVVGIPVEVELELESAASPGSAGKVCSIVALDVASVEQKEGKEEEDGEQDGMDRLSDLPNDVIFDILGRLPLREAVRARILSRRWRDLSTSPPRRSLAAALLFADTESTDGDDDEDAITMDEEDWISRLPDHLLSCILSRVPLVEAVRTSALGRRWRQVWTMLPCLVLDDVAARAAGVTNFLDLADGVLGRCCGGMSIDRFTIRVANPENIDGARLAAWSARAAECVIGTVSFRLDILADFLERQTVFEIPSMAEAECFSVYISHPEEVTFRMRPTANREFARLTRMALVGTRFRADDGGRSIGQVISQDCPLLSSLRLEDVRGVEWIGLRSSSLVELTLLFVTDLKRLHIIAPELNSVDQAYCFVGKDATRLLVFAEKLKEVQWNDTWPASCHFGKLNRLEMLTVHRQNNPGNLQRVFSQFRTVDALYVNVSLDEDIEEVETELDSMTKPNYCRMEVLLSRVED